MQALKSQTALRRGGIVYLRTDELTPNPVQPRKRFDDESLEELSGSIKSYGILNPLTVRLRCGKYELVAGERRLRAAKIAGLEEVPCILIDVNMEDASLIALVENLQRRDLDFIEEALGISQLIRMFGMSQEEAARRIGKSQSAVANKLRLLKLPSDVLESLRQNGLTERHGRALLRLPNPVAQRAALEYIVDNGLTVAATDAYIDALLSAPEEAELLPPEQAVSITIAITPASSRATNFFRFFIRVSLQSACLWICFFFPERLSQPSLPFCPDYIRQVTVLSIGNIAKLPETVSLKRMKISGICCSFGIFWNKVRRQSTESSFPCPGGAVLPGAGLLKFGYMLCWQALTPSVAACAAPAPSGREPHYFAFLHIFTTFLW